MQNFIFPIISLLICISLEISVQLIGFCVEYSIVIIIIIIVIIIIIIITITITIISLSLFFLLLLKLLS